MTAAYVHIPFCEHICFYCDFNKVFLEGQPVDEYVDLLLREMELTSQQHPTKTLDTVYIGGGTPSTLTAEQLERLLSGMQQIFTIEKDAEFTCEANPESVSLEKFHIMKRYGVNRISMGVQSFNNRILKRIGRIHTAEQVETCVSSARVAGFTNISIDLIFRLPTQTLDDFKDTLEKAIALDLPHYSIYALILENKTIFYNLMRQGKLPLPSEDEEADMYAMAMAAMEEAGLKQYEISNYAKPGHQSEHNLAYWKNEEYFGFGAGAHGYIDGVRYQNLGPIQQYLEPLRHQKLPILARTTLSTANKMEEQMMLGLRTMKGVSIKEFEERFGKTLSSVYQPVLDELFAKELIQQSSDRIHLTERGKFLGNEVFRSFLF